MASLYFDGFYPVPVLLTYRHGTEQRPAVFIFRALYASHRGGEGFLAHINIYSVCISSWWRRIPSSH